MPEPDGQDLWLFVSGFPATDRVLVASLIRPIVPCWGSSQTYRLGRPLDDTADTPSQSSSASNSNQLPLGICVRFPNVPLQPGWRLGLGSSVRPGSDPGEPEEVASEVSWGGLAGTIWWINPQLGIASVLMPQRYFGFGNPYGCEFKRHAYKALGH